MTVHWETALFIFKHPDLSLIVIILSFAHPELMFNSAALPCDATVLQETKCCFK